MAAAPLFHLELNVVASWTNVATFLIHEPDFSCSTSDNGVHFLEAVNAWKRRQIRASDNNGSEIAQVLVAVLVF